MNSPITFSKEYLEVLKNTLKVFSDLPNKQSVLIFKQENTDNVLISSFTLNILVNITTTKNHVDFKGEEMGVTNFSEFMNYINAIGYLENQSGITKVEELSNENSKTLSFMFSGEHATYRMIVADPAKFDDEIDKKIPVLQKQDKSELAAEFYLDVDDLKRLVKDIQLMNRPNFFNLSIADSKIKLYIKGLQGQQFTKTIEDIKAKVYNDFTTRGADQDGNVKAGYKFFPLKIFDYMSYYGLDFNVRVGLHPRKKLSPIMFIKSYATIKIDGKDDINILIGAKESASESVVGFDIVE